MKLAFRHPVHQLAISLGHTRNPNEQFFSRCQPPPIHPQTPNSGTYFSVLISQNHFPLPILIFLLSLSHEKSSFHTFLFHDLNLRSLLLQTPLCCILVLTIIFSLLHELRPLPNIDRSHQASRMDLTNLVQWSHHCSIQKFIENFKILCWVLNQKEVRC